MSIGKIIITCCFAESIKWRNDGFSSPQEEYIKWNTDQNEEKVGKGQTGKEIVCLRMKRWSP